MYAWRKVDTRVVLSIKRTFRKVRYDPVYVFVECRRRFYLGALCTMKTFLVVTINKKVKR